MNSSLDTTQGQLAQVQTSVQNIAPQDQGMQQSQQLGQTQNSQYPLIHEQARTPDQLASDSCKAFKRKDRVCITPQADSRQMNLITCKDRVCSIHNLMPDSTGESQQSQDLTSNVQGHSLSWTSPDHSRNLRDTARAPRYCCCYLDRRIAWRLAYTASTAATGKCKLVLSASTSSGSSVKASDTYPSFHWESLNQTSDPLTLYSLTFTP